MHADDCAAAQMGALQACRELLERTQQSSKYNPDHTPTENHNVIGVCGAVRMRGCRRAETALH